MHSNELYYIEVSILEQTMTLFKQGSVIKTYIVSTATNGPGEENGSECTPRGLHQIRAKVGGTEPLNSVFVGRRPTGEIYTPELAKNGIGRDWILTRILWLSGLEVGKNRLGNVDTMRRYVYIHGTPDSVALGKPGSRGCVRMRNSDIVELFDSVPVGTKLMVIP